jgi:hypothetical protein
VSGDNVYGMSGVIYQSGVIYIFRDLTGSISYDTPMGSPQVNWTRADVISGTIVITG